MRYAVISDIHSNLHALRAVFDRIDAMGIDTVYCLGDVVGYCAEPSECIQIIRDRCRAVVMGNHDQAVMDDAALPYLPRDGQEAALHNREALSDEDLTWLGSLPLVHEEEGSTFVHASPERPNHWLRIESFQSAQAQFNHFTSPVCFVGHTHMPAVLSDTLGVLRVRPGHRFVINVGSVGQPRDGDPRACFGIFDDEAFEFSLERVPYNVEQTAARIHEAGLPERLAKRLERGA